MEKEIMKKLDILINHWIEHNREHAAEYEKWALAAKNEGLEKVFRAIHTAGEVIQKCNNNLLEALNTLRGHKESKA